MCLKMTFPKLLSALNIPVICLLPCVAFAQQQSFSLLGSLNEDSVRTMVYLEYIDHNNQKLIDSSSVINSSFSFKGRINEPTEANIYFNSLSPVDGREGLFLYLEPNVAMKLSANSFLANAVITESQVNDDDRMLKSLVAPKLEKAILLKEKYY